ncbi:hypothetical protein C1H46_004339 [Malus baccata]|uniref:EDRF1 N-terminal domain-containing protein n=1 Tax=Malus baccata TaxID=106549 RepID=A0A540NGA6_MALBA|nr:hypothetical protein C1H46_004339 [Malus baccata]
MEKSGVSSVPSSSDGSRELQCIGKLEIERPNPVGFLCGSIPVPTDKAFHSFDSALIPSRQTVSAPRYRMLPTETDLKSPPLLSPEKVLPIAAVHSKAAGDIAWDGGTVTSNLTRKCEALAVSGLVEYGDEIDVIAPADILKQIFKMPYSKARLSIAVQRVDQTLVLNTGPDIEEGEKLIRRRKNQSKGADQSLFLNFAMHSVRMEACDCPPTHHVPSREQSNSSVLPGANTQFVGQHNDVAPGGKSNRPEYAQVKGDDFFMAKKKDKKNKGRNPVKKASQVGEKSRISIQESEKHRRAGNDGFLRVLFWQFHNFRMLIGSDLLLFSNEKYVAVSLHLWDVSRQVTPLTWLEAWLDNVMASVPEMAICYHENGVVQGYELLKTDDICLLKGISEDGAPAFHPHVVQQNGLSVLRFLQENCKQDPGAYWLYKNAGEDVIQLFDLSVIPKNCSSDDCDDSSSSLPSLLHRGRSDSLYSLGTLLYRSAHRLSLSVAPNNMAKCARFFQKCLEFLDAPDHLAYKEDCQLHQVLKVVEWACSGYGSMPQHLEDTKFISSMNSFFSSPTKFNYTNKKTTSSNSDQEDLSSSSTHGCLSFEQFSSIYLFWAKAWTLVGDVYVEFHLAKDSVISPPVERKHSIRELKVSSEVVKEVKRLKKKLGQHTQNCSSCSLVNCSCQSDRASSGSSASSSGDMSSVNSGRKYSKRPHAKSNAFPLLGDPEDDGLCLKMENGKVSDCGYLNQKRNGKTIVQSSSTDKFVGKHVESGSSGNLEGTLGVDDMGPILASQTNSSLRETMKLKNGGIFKYLGGPAVRDAENNLSEALCCYGEATKALGGLPSSSAELQSIMKKKGWVCNELGRNRLEKKELKKAELAFVDAIKAFREVSDHTNIILINCNLGHGRRALAEEMVSKIDNLKGHPIFHNAYNQALETAKLEYSESLKYYGAAKAELDAFVEEAGSDLNNLRTEVYTQFAHTYLRLGMLLAREDTTVDVYETGVMVDVRRSTSPSGRKSRKQSRKHEISANDAIREALSVYESLGELRKQEAAYSYFQLACYHRDRCLKFLEPDHKKNILSKGENTIIQRVKQYASLAERNMQKAMDFYGPKTHPTMYLTILIERSALSLSLSSPLHSNAMLESALSCLLEGRYVSEADSDCLKTNHPEVHAKFWNQLQMLLKKMLGMALSSRASKSSVSQPASVSNRCGDTEKLRQLYKFSLNSTKLNQLDAMHFLWTS